MSDFDSVELEQLNLNLVQANSHSPNPELDTKLASQLTQGFKQNPQNPQNKKTQSRQKKKIEQASSVLSNHIFDTIKEEIVSGTIVQGSKIVESDFAKRFNTSRGPLREALHRLEQTNLVIRTPHSRSEVVRLTHELMKEVYQMRKILEGFATRLACEVMSDDDIASLETIVAKHEKDIEQNNGKNYWQEEGDMDFHYAIYSKCGSHLIIDYLSNKLYQITRMCRRHISGIKKRSLTGFAEHESSVKASGNNISAPA